MTRSLIQDPAWQAFIGDARSAQSLSLFLFKAFGLYRVNIDHLRVGELQPFRLGRWVQVNTDTLWERSGSAFTCEENSMALAIKKGWLVPFFEYGKVANAQARIRPPMGITPMEPSIPSRIARDPASFEARVSKTGATVGYTRGGCTSDEIRSFNDALAGIGSRPRMARAGQGPIIDDDPVPAPPRMKAASASPMKGPIIDDDDDDVPPPRPTRIVPPAKPRPVLKGPIIDDDDD